jgi:hypothetical protein
VIPINEAIEAGVWLKVSCNIKNNFRCRGGDGRLEFRMRLREFKRIDLSQYPSFSASNYDSESNIWVLKIDIVHSYQAMLRSDLFGDIIDLKDGDGYIFARCQDSDVTLSSPFAESTGLRNFYCYEIPPKIKKSGSFAYELPEDFSEMYAFASYPDGKIAEA